MRRASKIRAVAFDLDGLMFNTEELYEHVGAELIRRRGHRMDPSLLRGMMGRPARIALRLMIQRYSLDDTVEELQRETEDIFRKILPNLLAPMPGFINLLEALVAANIPRAITTSSRRSFVQQVLQISNIEADQFEFYLTSEDVSNGKPHPEIYESAARNFEIATHEMMVLEDSEIGCSAAVSAGTFAVAVPGKHSSTHSFDGASLVAESLADPRIYATLGLA